MRIYYISKYIDQNSSLLRIHSASILPILIMTEILNNNYLRLRIKLNIISLDSLMDNSDGKLDISVLRFAY
jgi:hypothetical protein